MDVKRINYVSISSVGTLPYLGNIELSEEDYSEGTISSLTALITDKEGRPLPTTPSFYTAPSFDVGGGGDPAPIVQKWLQGSPSDKLHTVHELSRLFPNGPPEGQLHLVAVYSQSNR